MKIKIAIDTNVGYKKRIALENMGYDVVVVANQAEPDILWVHRAWAAGASFIISNDSDIPRIIEREGYPAVWIDYPNDNPTYKHVLVTYVDQMIKFKLKTYKRILEEAV